MKRTSLPLRRREFIAGLGGAAAWPVVGRAQQPPLPVIGYISGTSADVGADRARAFHQGLGEVGYVEGQNVMVEYHWLEGQYDRLPALTAELVRRRVSVIATLGSNPAALAAKAATTTIPIVFGVGVDPARLGLVASLPRPGGNATGINYVAQDVTAKRLGLLHDLVPRAVRIGVLVNPANPSTAERYWARHASSLTTATLARRLVGKRRAHLDRGFGDPTKDDLVRTVLRGIRRVRGFQDATAGVYRGARRGCLAGRRACAAANPDAPHRRDVGIFARRRSRSPNPRHGLRSWSSRTRLDRWA